ncbi:hypothetical protein BS47DRAFT_1360762 [Hydnum rufescens UP504]|uniref:Uncharacterized protein n=1 Tax=Hydnum rufescens UP504 TaxID=1448309 RepID=A0A9P6B1B0_9AGAM|nr:hypothetical protein BS47DRAFT_1360762 [Hydnum rufescens UP504]
MSKGLAPEPAATYTMTDNGLPHPHSRGHPFPQQNPTQQEHGQSPNRKYRHVQPLKISPDQGDFHQGVDIVDILLAVDTIICLSGVETMKGLILEPHWGPMAPHWGIWAQLGPHLG